MDIELSKYNIKSIANSDEGFADGVFNNGHDNRFPDYLDSLYNSSPTHQAVINDLVDYIYGKGLKVDPSSEEKLKKFFPKKVLKQIIRSKILQAAVPLEIIKNHLQDVVEINFIGSPQIRVAGINGGKPTKFVYRSTWDEEKYEPGLDKNLKAINKHVDHGLYYWYDNGTFNNVYYGRPRYLSGLNAIELEVAIYLMHNNGAQQGMFPSGFLSLITSGDDKKDKQRAKDINEAISGAKNAGKLAIDFRPRDSEAAQLSTPNLTGIDKVYENQYVTAESGIMKAHQIPSSTLIAGLNQKPTGFGSAAEEMEFSMKILHEKRIEPEREEILEILEPVFNMLEIKGAEFIGEETQMSFSKVSLAGELISKGEKMEDLNNDGWEVLDVTDTGGYEQERERNAKLEEKGYVAFASTGTARPNANSNRDGNAGVWQYKVRYRYAGDSTGEREFCRLMLSADKLYRFEDIQQMGSQGVNPGFGPGGANSYDIFLYKGGVNCHHRWERVVFVKRGLKGSIDVRNPRAKRMTQGEASSRHDVPDTDSPLVGRRPIDMPNRGALSMSKIMEKLEKIWKF